MPKPPGLLRDLAGRAAAWLGRAGARGRRATTAIETDRFDRSTWAETREASAELDNLEMDLGAKFNYAPDLLADLFAAAYKTHPQLRGPDQIEESREVNRQIMAHMLASPELAELRRNTVGDPWAAAMAVLASSKSLRDLLARTRKAHEAARTAAAAETGARNAARDLADALAGAEQTAAADGTVPADHAAKVEAAIGKAEDTAAAAEEAAAAAAAALEAAGPAIRAGVHHVLAAAAGKAEESAEASRAWGLEPGQLSRLDFEDRTALAARLQSLRLAQFTDLIGRFRQMAEAKRARHVEGAPGELVGVTLGDDLSRLVPHESAALAHPALRAVWAARFAERQLMLFHSRGTDQAAKGAIIACIDCSGSMASRYGSAASAEAWAKGLALALLDQSRAQHRDFAAILFSSPGQIEAFDFPAAEAVDAAGLLGMVSHFFGGGTDFQEPLDAATARLAAEHAATGKSKGDIVFITDGIAKVDPDWLADWREAKARLGFRVFGVGIGPEGAYEPGSVLADLADNTRTIADLADPSAAADLFTTI